MSRPHAASGSIAAQQSPADRWISRAAAGTVAGLASLAGAISYSHMRQLAQQHGQAGWHAHSFPLSVDGLELVASLVLLPDRRHARRSGWLPWTALITGTAASFAANIATAHPDPVSRTIAGWPAVAVLLAVKLLSGILGQDSTSALAADPSDPVCDQSTGDPPPLTAAPIPSRPASPTCSRQHVPPGTASTETATA